MLVTLPTEAVCPWLAYHLCPHTLPHLWKNASTYKYMKKANNSLFVFLSASLSVCLSVCLSLSLSSSLYFSLSHLQLSSLTIIAQQYLCRLLGQADDGERLDGTKSLNKEHTQKNQGKWLLIKHYVKTGKFIHVDAYSREKNYMYIYILTQVTINMDSYLSTVTS